MKISDKTKIIIFSITIFIIGIGIGYSFEYKNNYNQTKDLVTKILPEGENNFGYKFIYPLIRYDFGDAKYFFENKDLEMEINNYVEQQYKNKKAESISVYFTDLSNGQWSGVNENTEYHPGSMMKVLIMMAYYRERQLDRTVLEKTLVYDTTANQIASTVPYAMKTNLIVGQSYTIQNLIDDMIKNSDNGAETLLLEKVDQNILNDAYKDLKISSPENDPDYTISPKDYSDFLKILYNATYLSEKGSEEALQTMSQTTFRDGLTAGVPSDVLVAQKYGEKIDTDTKTNKIIATELHNCGIIYAKEYPYELCVMTKTSGSVDPKEPALIIKNISTIVYNYITNQ